MIGWDGWYDGVGVSSCRVSCVLGKPTHGGPKGMAAFGPCWDAALLRLLHSRLLLSA